METALFPPCGVIFDCDGTLMDTMGLWIALEDDLAAEAGHVLTEAEVASLRTFTIDESARFFHGLGLGTSESDVVGLINERLAWYYATRARLRPGVAPFLERLSAAGVACAIASSSPHALLDPGIACTGIGAYIDAVVSTDDVGASKRTPAAYDRARELLGTPLASTWVFEDAIYALRCARDAGYRCVGVWDRDDSGTLRELSDVGDAAVRSFEELDVERFLSGGYARGSRGGLDARTLR